MSGTEIRPREQGLVLAGGAAHGAYSVGVMEALFQGRWQRGNHGAIEAAVFSGTSVGAYNAAIMAQGGHESCRETVRRLRHFWIDRIASIPGKRPNGVYRIRGDIAQQLLGRDSPATVWRQSARDARSIIFRWLRRGLSLGFSEDDLMRRMLRLGDLGDLISTDPLMQLVEDTVHGSLLLHPAAKTLRVATTQWDFGKSVVFHNKLDAGPTWAPFADYTNRPLTEANLSPALCASAAVPGFFPRVRFHDQDFVDGGLLLNAPLTPAVESGARVIHVVTSQHRIEPIHLGRSPSLFETLERLIFAMPAALVEWDIARARRINEMGISLRNLLAQAPSVDPRHISPIIRAYIDRPKLIIHRYFPHKMLGGAPSLLNFQQRKIIELIEHGFRDAVNHDCRANGCVI